MSKSPWGGIGAWAAEAERAEAEELAAAAQAESQSFPSLKEAVTSKPKKKKATTLSLSAFNLGSFSSSGGPPASTRVGLTPEEMMRLPTGPTERAPEEMQYGRLGGGFPSYGRSSGPNPGRGGNRDDSDGSWGGGGRRSYSGFDDERRGGPHSSRVSDFDQPSRADEVDNWAMTKKSLPSVDSGRQNRYGGVGGVGGGVGSVGGGGGGSPGAWSRADEVDNWAVGKKLAPAPASSRPSTFGSGFGNSGPEPDRWARGGGGREVDRVGGGERPRLVLDPPKAGEPGANEQPPPLQVVKTNKASPFGEARPREQILNEKGLDWKKVDSEIEAKKTTNSSRPTSAHSSRPTSAQSSRSEVNPTGIENVNVVVKPRPKVNPFGDAKPREVLLEERGKDWRKIDLKLEHQGVDRPETEQERILKEEIDHLKKEFEKESTGKVNSETGPESGGDQPSLRDIILRKERELETLIYDLHDKVRFGQKAIDRPGSGAGRPGSGAGRAGSFLDRTPSYSRPFEDSRNTEFIDRPQSHGKGDGWTRPFDDRRSSFHGGRERGFLGNRDMGRARSRERW